LYVTFSNKPTKLTGMKTIYFDNNATTPVHDQVVETLVSTLQLGLKNPASQHGLGRQSRKQLEITRRRVADLLGGNQQGSEESVVVFTSGGTEANNLALQGICASFPQRGRLIISGVEHPSVTTVAEMLEKAGWDLQVVNTLPNGRIDLDHLGSLFNDETRLVSVMLANNETGVIQPIADVVTLCKNHGVLIHTDAVQAVGKMSIDFQQLGVDALSLSAHKIHGPVGVGALLIKNDCPITPILHGGFQQSGLRPGTEACPLPVAFSKTLEIYLDHQDANISQLLDLQLRLEGGVLGLFPAAVVVGHKSLRLPQTTCISFPGVDRQALMMALDVAGVCCSTGSACASGSSEPSPVLIAMGLPDDIVEGAIRFSLSILNTPAEVDTVIEILSGVLPLLSE
jgi:cysteine desulfurase